MNRPNDKRPANGRLAGKLALIAVGMFGFGFALWPLYNVFCDITGLGGRGVKIEQSATGGAQSDRQVRIRFDATVNSNLPWDFEAVDKSLTVTLGEMSEAHYRATNPTGEALAGHAIFNVTPPEASLYFVKTECFCFTQQILQAGETRDMPVYYFIQPDLPEHIKELTLSYTFFQDPGARVAQTATTTGRNEE
ncbi:MAG: cytochrome c oxidase assembly protein [Xanthomonadales bacterium]